MEPSEAIEHMFKTLSAYKERCNSDLREALDLSMELLDKKEKGLLVELPVPIGATVYSISKSPFEESYYITQVVVGWNDIKWLIDFCGKTVFATIGEAEKRLEELRNDRK